MIALTFTITTIEPVLLTSLQGDPNSSVSFHYIPGSVLRGAFIGQYLQQKKNANPDLIDDEKAQRLFFNGQTRFLNSYISLNNERSLPLPRSLRHQKRTTLVEGAWDNSDKTYQHSDHKAIGEMFGLIDKSCIRPAASVKTTLNIHTTRNRIQGRSTSDDGAIFRYEAIASEQIFSAAVICQTEKDAEFLSGLLPENLWLGGSRSAGYGKVSICCAKVDVTWQETTHKHKPKEDGNHTITLLSDAIIRDENGQYTSDMGAYLEKYGMTFQPGHSSIKTTLIGGFNRTWNLPLPQVQAIAMGSTIVVKVEDTNKFQEFQKFVETGLGERRAEGFGRFAIDYTPKTGEGGKVDVVQTVKNGKPCEDEPSNRSLTAQEAEIIKKIRERVLRQKMDQQLLKIVANHQIKQATVPSRTQLARLWLVARSCLNDNDLKNIEKFIKNLPGNAKQQFECASIGDKTLYTWLEELKQETFTWNGISINEPIPDELKTEYTLRAVMAIARHARKDDQNQEKQEQKGQNS